MMKVPVFIRIQRLCVFLWALSAMHQACAEGRIDSSQPAETPEVGVVKEAIYYVLSPESGLIHKQAAEAVYWIVRTACDKVPDQTPEIASMAIHAISRSSERSVLMRMAVANEISPEKARQLAAAVSATVTVTFDEYIRQTVKAVFHSPGLRRGDNHMLKELLDTVAIRLVQDLSLQAALSDRLMKTGKWMAATSLPIENGMNAADLTRDVCTMISDQALASGFDRSFVMSVFHSTRSKCSQYAQNEAQRHFDERVGSHASGLASKVASLNPGASPVQLYHPCAVVTALEQLRNRNSLSNMPAMRGVIRSSLREGR